MRSPVVMLATSLALCIGVALGSESALESLDASTALHDVRASKGVVFVDLYADW